MTIEIIKDGEVLCSFFVETIKGIGYFRWEENCEVGVQEYDRDRGNYAAKIQIKEENNNETD
jgi:hypothetical protein